MYCSFETIYQQERNFLLLSLKFIIILPVFHCKPSLLEIKRHNPLFAQNHDFAEKYSKLISAIYAEN